MAKHCMFCGAELVDGFDRCIVCHERITWAEKDIPDEEFDFDSDDWREPVSDPDPDSVSYRYLEPEPKPQTTPAPDPVPAPAPDPVPKPQPERATEKQTTGDASDQTYHAPSNTSRPSRASGTSSGGGCGCIGIILILAIVVAYFIFGARACSHSAPSSTKVCTGTAEELVQDARREGYGSIYNEHQVLDKTIIDNDKVTVAILGTGEYTVDGKKCAGVTAVVRANQPARLAFRITNERVGDSVLEPEESYSDVMSGTMSAGEYKMVGWYDETGSFPTYQGGSATLTVIDKKTDEVLGSVDFAM